MFFSNFLAVPLIYYLYPETGFRSLEEVDVLFHAASQQPNPWLNVRKLFANEPLWYSKDGEESFDYEGSEWHQRHVRFSDEIKDSEGGSHSMGSSPTQVGSGSEGVGKAISSDEDGEGEMSEKPRGWGEEACPSPVISRMSGDRKVRSAGRGS